MGNAIGFLAFSLGIAYISRASLRVPGSHGFYRFFAWEFILGLVLLNLNCWFCDPLSWYQMISWVFLLISLFLVIHAVRLLQDMGKPDIQRDDTPMIGVEKTTQLVALGAYRYIRHPLYGSLLFLAWGTFFKDPSWAGAILALGATLFLVWTAKVEEAENVRYFGAEYQTYMHRTRMFIPFLF